MIAEQLIQFRGSMKDQSYSGKVATSDLQTN